MYKDTAFSNEIKVKTGFFSRFFQVPMVRKPFQKPRLP